MLATYFKLPIAVVTKAPIARLSMPTCIYLCIIAVFLGFLFLSTFIRDYYNNTHYGMYYTLVLRGVHV